MLVPAWKRSLQNKVSSLFYRHGLFCASHPFSVIFGVICIVLVICYPLTRLPLPGNPPAEFSTPIAGYKIPPLVLSPEQSSESAEATDERKWPKWYRGPPVAYVQQILVKVTVSPWRPEELIPNDAFRAPLARAFEVLAHVDNFQEHSVSLPDLCLHVPETIAAQKVPKGLLPEYTCLVLSPAQLWNRDKNRFASDGEIIRTIYKNYGQNVNTPPSVRDILFGVAWKETGLKRFYLRNRQRVISYAITIVYEKYDPRFTAGLHQRLRDVFAGSVANDSDSTRLVHVHSEAVNYFVEYTPLLVSYLLLFLYIYFSVRKIEMVKSKWGLAFSAVVMVITSLLMSVSICLSFGLTPSLKGSEIFPYLVVIIGLENVLVMTKSVVSTPVHLEVKLRVAQGLSKEGWYIFKNLMAELLILMVGFFTFVPAVQEFCLFAVVGLLSDFFLQNIFFATVLSIDIRRMELSDLHRRHVQQSLADSPPTTPHSSCIVVSPTTGYQPCPVLSSLLPPPGRPKLAAGMEGVGVEGDACTLPLAKRVRLWNFWARTRVAQRAIMVCVVLWIALIVYKTGLLGHFAGTTYDDLTQRSHPFTPRPSAHPFEKLVLREGRDLWQAAESAPVVAAGGADDGGAGGGQETVAPSILEPWRKLAHTHWSRLFSFYNISLLGRYITMLPSMHLSLTISPDDAISLRHPHETQAAALFSRYVATHPDKQVDDTAPVDKPANDGFAGMAGKSVVTLARHVLWAPQNRLDTVLTLLLGGATLLVLVCFLGTLYRRLCPRDYARRRRQRKQQRQTESAVYRKQIRDAVPLVLSGHTQEVECISVDGPLIASSCLAGEIRVWDSLSGECIRVIDTRKTVTSPRMNQIDNATTDIKDTLYDDVFHDFVQPRRLSLSSVSRPKSGSRPYSTMPDLRAMIDTHFTNMVHFGKAGEAYDFAERFESCFSEHRAAMADAAAAAASGREACAMGRVDEGVRNRQSHSFSLDSPPRMPSPPAIPDTITDAASSIWCLCCHNNLVLAGCGGGSIEFWDALTGQLKCCYLDNTVGVTDLCIVDNRVVAARQNGSLDFLELRTYTNSQYTSQPLSSESQLHNRGHMARPTDTVGQTSAPPWDGGMSCVILTTVYAHQRPITILQIAAGHVITGSRDHTLKVFRLEDAFPLYTLHGHRGSITVLHVDTVPPLSAASGSADGTVRLWNLAGGGACVHKLDGQSDAVSALVTTRHHVVSAAMDDCLCVWQRANGRPMHRLQMGAGSCNSLAMLTHTLMISGGRGCLYLWDILRGEVLRVVPLGDHSYSVFIRQVYVIGHCTVACDCGNQLRVVHFPSVLEKVE